MGNANITEANWPGTWPDGGLSQGWGFCFIEAAPGGQSKVFYTPAFPWAGEQTAFRTSFLAYVNSTYRAAAVASMETCAFTTQALNYPLGTEDPLQSARDSENVKAANNRWSIVNTSWKY